MRVESMYMSPVKSLGLQRVTDVVIDKPGMPGDRMFFIVGADGEMVTQRECPRLVQVSPDYDAASGILALTLPGGETIAGIPETAEEVTGVFDERPVQGHAVTGRWSEALSEFAGQAVRLVKVAVPGSAFDGFPISICSLESLDAVAKAAGVDDVDGRRFRQNIYVSGAPHAHAEDTWIGGRVRAGEALLSVKMADPRCVMTTQSPDTGEHDMDTLRIIASYRTDQPKEVNFGVYATVVRSGRVRIGDEVEAMAAEAAR